MSEDPLGLPFEVHKLTTEIVSETHELLDGVWTLTKRVVTTRVREEPAPLHIQYEGSDV